MSESEKLHEYMNAEFCRSHPIDYRLCTGAHRCVHVDTPCPCRHGAEYRCSDGQCIPSSDHCNGVRDCSRGDDESTCPGRLVASTEDGLPVHVIIIIASVCILVCLVVICVLGYFVLRRRKNNTSTESQSATKPLRTRYPSSVVDTQSDKYDESSKTSRRDYVYYPMYDASGDYAYQRDKQSSNNTKETPPSEVPKPQSKKIVPLICSLRNMKVYDFDSDSCSGDEMGKYIFKPRLKSALARTSQNETQTNENHEIVHSYKHAKQDMVSLPVPFNLDLDPDNFNSAFATDLLCASTPRQPQRRLVLLEPQLDLTDNDTSIAFADA